MGLKKVIHRLGRFPAMLLRCHARIFTASVRLGGLVLLSLLCNLSAAFGADSEEGTSNPAAKKQAIQRIPFTKLNQEARHKLQSVVEDPSIFRRMPSQELTCDPEMFVFLVRYPEVLVNLWQLMGVSNVVVDRIAPFMFCGEDGAGTKCNVELIYGTENLHIFYGTGTYDGLLTNRGIAGRCVCVIQSQPVQNESLESAMAGQMDVFVRLDNLGADLIAKTIGPFVGKTADYNFVESAKFISQISQSACRNPVAIQQLARRLDNVQPNIREEFVAIAFRAAMRSRRTMSLEEAVQAGLARAAESDSLTNDAVAMEVGKVPVVVEPQSARTVDPKRLLQPAKSEVLIRR